MYVYVYLTKNDPSTCAGDQAVSQQPTVDGDVFKGEKRRKKDGTLAFIYIHIHMKEHVRCVYT